MTDVENGKYNINKNDDEIRVFLKTIKLVEYYDVFIDNGFDSISDIKLINKNALMDMKITKVAHQIRILNAVNERQNNICEYM